MSKNNAEYIMASFSFNDTIEISEVPENFIGLKKKIKDLFKLNEDELNNYDISYIDLENEEIYIIDEETYERAKLISEHIVFTIKPKKQNEYKDNLNYENEFSKISKKNEDISNDEEFHIHRGERRRGKGRIRPSTRNKFRQNYERENDRENEIENNRENDNQNFNDENNERGNFNRGRKWDYRGHRRNYDRNGRKYNNNDYKGSHYNNYNNRGNYNYQNKNFNFRYNENFNRTDNNKNKDNNNNDSWKNEDNNNYHNFNYNRNDNYKQNNNNYKKNDNFENNDYNQHYNKDGNFNNNRNNYYQNNKWKYNYNNSKGNNKDYNDYNNKNKDYNNKNKDYNNEEDHDYYDIKKQLKYERQKFFNDFKEKYNKIIIELGNVFNNEIEEEKIIEILINITSSPSLTIFEAMNLIYREVTIWQNFIYNTKKINRRYGPESDIFEEKTISDSIQINLIKVIQNYKIYNENEKLKKNWLYINHLDKRRKILKDENGFYNYLPIIKYSHYKNTDDIYAKNENEVLYHFLFYKTLICKHCDLTQENSEIYELCPYAHNILRDFRIIYDYQDENIINFMKLLFDSNLFKFENYLKYIPRDLSQFNFDSFKVHQCMLDSDCPKDYQLCPYYHKSIEKDKMRRPQSLFRYSGIRCSKCFNEKKGKFYPKKCILGIFCPFCHNENEYNYHNEHFRKEEECKNKKINGKCKYYKTCYKIHSSKFSDNDDSEEEEEEIEEKDIIEDDGEILKLTENINCSVKIGRYFECRNCCFISSIGQICYFIECNHFICFKCFKSIYRTKNKIVLCPFCNKQLNKKKIIFCKFN